MSDLQFGADSARYHSFAQRMPLQHALAIALVALEMYALAGTVPWVIGVGIPCLIILFSALRGLSWHRISKTKGILPDDAARAKLDRSAKVMLVAWTVFLCRDIALYVYSPPEQRAFVQVQLLLLCLCQLFFLKYFPRVSSLMALLSTTVLVALSLHMETQISIAIVLSILVVLASIASVVREHDSDFEGVVRAAAELKRLSAENARLASQDALTGLPNRRVFFRTLAQAQARAIERDTPLAVGIADLDGFKLANDTWGHKVGDQVLSVVADRMRANAGTRAQVFRLGGDEFAFIVEEEAQPELLTLLGEALIASISLPIPYEATSVHVGCSIGVAIYPLTIQDMSKICEKADEALYASKHQGRGRVTISTGTRSDPEAPQHMAILRANRRPEGV